MVRSSDYRDLSELPGEDDAYWQTLESAVLDHVRARAVDSGADSAWSNPLAKRAAPLAWLAAAGLAALLLMPRAARVREPALPLLRLPDDPFAAVFLSPASPPDLATLLISPAGQSK